LAIVYAVVLAAGRGERFGGDKLLATWRGRPLLWHALAPLRSAVESGELAGGCVVVPPDAPALAVLAREAGMVPVVNPAPAAGLGSSLRVGFDWLTHRVDDPYAAAVFCLGDQPAMRPDVLARLVEAWTRREGLVVRPRYADAPAEPGHPTLVDRSLWGLANGLTGDAGLGFLLAERGIPVVTIDVAGRNPDVDTRTDLLNLEGTDR
jgi:molybdenum cofactor cytidylyltransferase